MNKTEAMKTLESLGSEQTRKTWRRHGITGDCFGVKYGDLYKVVKQIGTDQKLADQLWATGNHDARVLATMIADPAQMTQSSLDQWATSANNQLDVDAVGRLAWSTDCAKSCFEKWIKSKSEWQAATGWHILAGGCCGRPGDVAEDFADLPDSYFEKQLAHIEKNIHKSQNRVRYSMNAAVIGIGMRNSALQKKALDAAKRIGKVEVDHGDTSCKTPDAHSYILKAAAHNAKKKNPSVSKAGTKRKATTTAAKKTPTNKKVAKKKTLKKNVAARS